MEHTFEELSAKTVVQLKEIAKGNKHEALHGYTTMHKEQLLLALCKAMGIDTHKHHAVVGINKGRIKAQIKELKAERDTALNARDHKRLKMIRRKIHHLKRKIRRATV